LRPSTRTLRIFSALSLMSVSLCLQPARQNAWAQGSADKNASGLTSYTPMPMPLPASAASPTHASSPTHSGSPTHSSSTSRALFLPGAKLSNKPLAKPLAKLPAKSLAKLPAKSPAKPAVKSAVKSPVGPSVVPSVVPSVEHSAEHSVEQSVYPSAQYADSPGKPEATPAQALEPSLVKPIKPNKSSEQQPRAGWQKSVAVSKSQLKSAASKTQASKPAMTKPVATSPVASRPVAGSPDAASPVASSPAAASPVATKPVATKPAATRPVATRPAGTRPVATKPALPKSFANFSAAPSSVIRAAKEAEKKIQDHDLASAVNIWSTEIEAHPENAESWVGRASVKRMIGDYHGAQDDLDHALELNANSVPALISRAAVRRRLADLRGAAKDIDRAVELAPRSYQAFAERSSLRFALNDMQGAMADYNYAITINPEMNKQAAKYSYSANSQPQITIRDARDVSKVDTNKSAAENKTIAETKSGNENKTIIDTKSSAETKSSSETKSSAEIKTATDTRSNEVSDTHYTSAELAHLNNTAVHEINLKHFASAIKTFERLLEISPNYAHAKDNLVIAHNNYGLELAMRHPEEALKQFRAALYLDPSQAAIRKNVSAIMRENGQDPTSIEDRMTIADQCLAKGEAEGAFIELSEALRIKNTPKLREKLQVALAAIYNNDSRRANQALTQRDRDKDRDRDRDKIEVKLDPRQEAKAETRLEAKLETKPEAKLAAKLTAKEELNTKAVDSDMPPPTILGTITPALPEQRSTMTTIADLPNATLRTREPVAMRPIRDHEDKPALAMPLESPSATPGYDEAFIKATLDNTPETVLQVARQLASENRELDAEALLNRLCDILRKRILKGDRASEQTLENTLETLSELYIKSNRLQNAEPTLRELIAIREKTKSPDDHILGKTLAEYSNVLKSLGRNEEASKHEQKANVILNQLSAH